MTHTQYSFLQWIATGDYIWLEARITATTRKICVDRGWAERTEQTGRGRHVLTAAGREALDTYGSTK